MAHKLFAEALLYTVIVCDRYSAYKRLVRLLGGLVILAFCWAHVRQDFIECLAGQVELTQWCQGWIELIASLYRLNDERLEHYDPGVQRQTPAFDAAQGALEEALDGLFAQAARELAGLVERVLPAHPLVQARRRAQGHDGQGHHAGHAPRDGVIALPPPKGASVAGATSPLGWASCRDNTRPAANHGSAEYRRWASATSGAC